MTIDEEMAIKEKYTQKNAFHHKFFKDNIVYESPNTSNLQYKHSLK